MHITAPDSLRLRLRTRALSLATIALLAVVAVVAAPVVWAHEIGTSRVLITFTAEGEYVIEVTADAAALLARLETQSGRPRSGTLPRDSYPDRIASLAPTLRAPADVRNAPADWSRQPDLQTPAHRQDRAPPALARVRD